LVQCKEVCVWFVALLFSVSLVVVVYWVWCFYLYKKKSLPISKFLEEKMDTLSRMVIFELPQVYCLNNLMFSEQFIYFHCTCHQMGFLSINCFFIQGILFSFQRVNNFIFFENFICFHYTCGQWDSWAWNVSSYKESCSTHKACCNLCYIASAWVWYLHIDSY